MISPIRVLIESPFKATSPEGEARNVRYVRACMRDSLLRGEAPFASHALYTLEGVLKDGDPAERKLGMEAGWAYLEVCKVTAVYTDLGISDGMRAGIERQRFPGVVSYRQLGADWVIDDWMKHCRVMTGSEQILQGIDFAYGNLAASTHHRPRRGAFKGLALDRGLSDETFEEWADTKEWW
jgi:hypothetical protein